MKRKGATIGNGFRADTPAPLLARGDGSGGQRVWPPARTGMLS